LAAFNCKKKARDEKSSTLTFLNYKNVGYLILILPISRFLSDKYHFPRFVFKGGFIKIAEIFKLFKSTFLKQFFNIFPVIISIWKRMNKTTGRAIFFG